MYARSLRRLAVLAMVLAGLAGVQRGGEALNLAFNPSGQQVERRVSVVNRAWRREASVRSRRDGLAVTERVLVRIGGAHDPPEWPADVLAPGQWLERGEARYAVHLRDRTGAASTHSWCAVEPKLWSQMALNTRWRGLAEARAGGLRMRCETLVPDLGWRSPPVRWWAEHRDCEPAEPLEATGDADLVWLEEPGLWIGHDQLDPALWQAMTARSYDRLDAATALRFLNQLSALEGRALAYQVGRSAPWMDPRADGYRLPTLGEWRAGLDAGAIHATAAGALELIWDGAGVDGRVMVADPADPGAAPLRPSAAEAALTMRLALSPGGRTSP